MQLRYRLAIALLMGAIIISMYVLVSPHINLTLIKQYANNLERIVDAHYVPSVILYFIVFIVASCLLPHLTIILTLVGGYVYGFAFGTIYAVIGATCGGIVISLLVRTLFGEYMQRRYASALARFNEEMKRHGHWYLLALQLLPISPVIIYVWAGLAHLSWVTLAWTTCLGLIPGTVLYAWFGQRLHTINNISELFTRDVILVGFLLALLTLIPVLWFYYQQYRKRIFVP